MQKKIYMLIEINKGLTDGWYTEKECAEQVRDYFNEEYKDEQWFLLYTTEDNFFPLGYGQNAIGNMDHVKKRGI